MAIASLVLLALAQSVAVGSHPLDLPVVESCEAPPGYYTPEELEPSPSNLLRAQIRLVRPDPHQKWWSAGGLLFVLRGHNRYAGVQVFVDPERTDLLQVGVKVPNNDSPTTLLSVPVGETVEVATQLKKGVLTVWAAGAARSVKIKNAKVKKAILMCSSGDFEFRLQPGELKADQ